MIYEKIKNDLKEAMREKDDIKKNALRGVISAITNELVARKMKPNDTLDDKSIIEVIKRQVKQRKDSINQYKEGGRIDLAEKEEKELNILKKYLPAEMPRDELEKIIQKKIKELSINDKSEIGKLMGQLMKDLGGRADGNVVKEIAEHLLS